MRNLLLTLSYDGSGYHGWQIQENAPTVQEAFQAALYRATGLREDLKACSRTDTGVPGNSASALRRRAGFLPSGWPPL